MLPRLGSPVQRLLRQRWTQRHAVTGTRNTKGAENFCALGVVNLYRHDVDIRY